MKFSRRRALQISAGVLAAPAIIRPAKADIWRILQGNYGGDGRTFDWQPAEDHSLVPRTGPTLTHSGGANSWERNAAGVWVNTNGARLNHYTAGGISWGFLHEPARTWRALHNRDFTNAAWSKSNITATKDATGIDGEANSASTLTATDANSTALQAVTLGSAERTSSCWVKRKTGTGDIDITDNGGSNWTTLTGLSSSIFTKHSVTRTQANPEVGLRVVTSGDEIEVDFFGLEEGAYATSPLEVGASAVTRTTDSLTLSDVGAFPKQQGTILSVGTLIDPTDTTAHIFNLHDANDSDEVAVRVGSNARAQLQIDSGGSQTGFVSPGGTVSADTEFRIASRYQADNFGCSIDQGTVASDTSGATPVDDFVSLSIGDSRAGNGTWAGTISQIVFWPVSYGDAALRGL